MTAATQKPVAPGPEAARSQGTVLARDDVTVLDTREMEWEGSTQVSGVLRKVLARDSDGDPIIVMRWLSQELKPSPPGRAGEYHTARELFYYLGGEFAHWEQDPTSDNATVARRTPFREGYFMDRLPGSIHGGNSDTPLQACGIGWMTHTDDPFVGSLESAHLTRNHRVQVPTVPGDPAPALDAHVTDAAGSKAAYQAATAFELPLVRIVRGRELAWERHPVITGALERVLARRANGDPTLSLLRIPPGRFPLPALPARISHAYRELTYVIEGELTEWSYTGEGDTKGDPVRLLPGYWVDRRPGSLHGYENDAVSPTGCVMLRMRARADAGFVKEQDKYTVWTRTLTDEPGSRARYATADEHRAYLRQRGRDEHGRLLGAPAPGDRPGDRPR